jgi:hypothetical protein
MFIFINFVIRQAGDAVRYDGVRAVVGQRYFFYITLPDNLAATAA